MRKLREDLALVADVVTVGLPVLAVLIWLVHGRHWTVAGLIAGGLGWLVLVTSWVGIWKHLVKAKPPPWDPVYDAPEEDQSLAYVWVSVILITMVLLPLAGVALLSAVVAVVFGSILPLEILGVLAFLVPLPVGARGLASRYRSS